MSLCGRRLARAQDTLAQEIEARASIHGPGRRLQLVHLAFRLALTPLLGEGGHDSRWTGDGAAWLPAPGPRRARAGPVRQARTEARTVPSAPRKPRARSSCQS